MAAGNPTLVLTHPRLDSLPAGTVLWHIHPEAFASTAFNPKSENRFAAGSASPPRAMYYAGASPEVAIWETLLRDVVADEDGCVVLFKDRIDGKRLARVRTTRAIAIVDLRMPGLRRHTANAAELSEWQGLQTVFPYASTQAAARALLAVQPTLGGLQWTSKQAGNGAAFVFYDPPASDLFKPLSDRSLSGKTGWRPIDRALNKPVSGAFQPIRRRCADCVELARD